MRSITKMRAGLSSFAVLAAIGVGSAFGMADDKPKSGGSTDGGAGGLLSGPSVEQGASDAETSPMPGPNTRQRGQQIPLQRWMGALRGLGLSDEQMTQARAIGAEFEAAQKSFQTEHADELRAMREARQKMGEGGTADPALREEFQALEAGRPKPQPYQERIWAILTPEQQEVMKGKLDEIEKSSASRRGDQYGDGQRRRGEVAASESPDAMNSPDTMSEAPMLEPASTPAIPDRPRDRRRAASIEGRTDLDQASKRRLTFLRAHQSADRPGGAPTAMERQFDFNEPSDNENSAGSEG